MINYFPKYFSNRAMVLYIALLLTIPVVFGHPMYWYWWAFGVIEVCGFFYFSNALSQTWRGMNEKQYERLIFRTSLGIRVAYVLLSYAFYLSITGVPFEMSAADSLMYDSVARDGADRLWNGSFDPSSVFWGLDLSDRGYPFYLSLLYALTGKSVLVSRLLKALMSAYTVVLIFRLANRNFGLDTARVAAMFCMLMPNLIYYCGLHLKETELLFVTVLFIERADAMFRSRSAKLKDIIFVFLICVVAFFFRAVLSYVLFLTLVATVVFGSKRLKRGGKWVIEGLLILVLGVVGYLQVGVESITQDEYDSVQEMQASNMQWRSQRKDGNSYAKYASASIFAPLIFTIPFPTMVNIEHQQNQQMIHGGNFVKNITSFFTILALFLLLFSGEWRDNIVPLAFMIGYLIVIAFSSFAQSERFHIPALPFELMFASYAITHFKVKYKNWFTLWLLFIFVANMGWAWFKLRGRGL